MSEESKSSKVRKVVRPVRMLLVILLGLLLVMMRFEDSLIFIPSRYPEGNWRLPAAYIEEAWFQADDGVKLHGWFAPHPEPRAIVLVAHGNAGNITHRFDLLRGLRHLGASVLVFDYRGYGRSEGKPNEPGVLADARLLEVGLLNSRE